MFIKTSFLAGEIKEFREVGNFFRLMESERDVTVIYYALARKLRARKTSRAAMRKLLRKNSMA
jgi:hypothetical protein